MGYFRAVGVMEAPSERLEERNFIHNFKPIPHGVTADFDHQFRLGDSGPSMADELQRVAGYLADVLAVGEQGVVVYVDRTVEYGHAKVYKRTAAGMDEVAEYETDEGDGPEPIEDMIQSNHSIETTIIQ